MAEFKGSKLKVAILLSLAVVILTALLPRTAKFNYKYAKGLAWDYETLTAQFDFPIYKTDEQLQNESDSRTSQQIPYYKYSEDIAASCLESLRGLEVSDSTASALQEAFATIYAKGVVDDAGIYGTGSDGVIYLQRDKRAAKTPAGEVYTVSSARNLLRGIFSDSLLISMDVYDCLKPNLLFDSRLTEIISEGENSQPCVTDGYVSAGQIIIAKGEIVTPEVEQILDSYKKEYEASVGATGPLWTYLIGNFVISAVLVTLLFFILYFTQPDVFEDNRFHYILMIFLFGALVTILVGKRGENLLFIVPYTLIALYLQAFFQPKLIVPVYLVSLLPLLLFSSSGPVLYTMFGLAGILSIYLFKYMYRGWKQFVVALVTFAVLLLVFVAFRSADMADGNVVRRASYLFVGSFLTVAGYPLIYLFEKLFNLLSNSRLLEISDTSNKLLRQLEAKAPGTLQHSLQVMNMADAAARAVEANPILVRAGALYHDIGKMNNPQCFVENESLVAKEEENKYHHDRLPVQSAQDIIRHVSDGVELARRNGLPQVIIDFIQTHHGTTTVNYFYSRFIAEGGSESSAASFRYNGFKPRTKEQIILMLCDSIEAASRTLSDYSTQSFSDFVERIVKGKMDEGQFDEANISIRELGIIKDVLKTYLAQIYHERIAYPDKIKNKQ